MNKFSKKLFTFFILSFSFSCFALPFNSKLSEEEKKQLNNGEVVIRNIDYYKNMCLESQEPLALNLKEMIKNLSPRYLSEIIQVKPYDGNENLPEKLEQLLLNVPDYAGIPLWSVRHECYYDLYSSAEITSITKSEDRTDIIAKLNMDPFGIFDQSINIYSSSESILYFSENLQTLRYFDKFDCVGPKKMNMCILLFREGDNWILYGIGGVNAPKIPFFTERIETSFISRIKTFCNFVFKKLEEQ